MKNFFEHAILTFALVAFLPCNAAQADSGDSYDDPQQQTSRDGSGMMTGFAQVTRNSLTDGGTKFFQFLTGNPDHVSCEESKRPSKSMLGMLSKLDAFNCLGVNPGWRQPFASKSRESVPAVPGAEAAPVTELMPVTIMAPVTVLAPVSVTREVTVTSPPVQNSEPVILRPEMR